MKQNAGFPQSPQFLPFSLCECDPPRRPISPFSLPFSSLSHFAHCPRNQSFRMCLSPSDAERREDREELKRRRRHTQQQAKHAATADTHLHPKPLEHAASPSCSRNIKLAGWLEESIAFGRLSVYPAFAQLSGPEISGHLAGSRNKHIYSSLDGR